MPRIYLLLGWTGRLEFTTPAAQKSGAYGNKGKCDRQRVPRISRQFSTGTATTAKKGNGRRYCMASPRVGRFFFLYDFEEK